MIPFRKLVEKSRQLEDDLKVNMVNGCRFGEPATIRSKVNDRLTALRDELELVQRQFRERIAKYVA